MVGHQIVFNSILYQEVAARYAGLTNQQVACDYQLAFDCTRKMAEEMGNDAVMLNAIWVIMGRKICVGNICIARVWM